MANRREAEKQKARRTNAKKVAEKQQGGFMPAWLKKLPKGIQMMKFKEEKVYRLDNVPFIVGNENPNADAGMEHCERTVYTHAGIGLDAKAHYLCPLMTSKEGRAKKMRPCPVCEHSQKLQMSGAAKEETDAFRPKKRQLFMFVDTRDREKGVQLHEGPYFFGLGQLIDRKMDALDEDSPKLNWWTYDEGMTIYVSVKKEAFKGQSFMKPVDLEIEPRQKQYAADLMEKGCCLDELVKELPYDELSEIFKQTGSADEAEEKAERNGKPRDDDDSDDDPTEHDDEAAAAGIKTGSKVKHKKFGECEVVHVSKDGTSLKLEDSDGDVQSGVDPAECKLVEADNDADDDDPPPAKGKKTKRPPVDQDDPDEDDSEPEDEDADDDEESEDDDDDPTEPARGGGKTKTPAKSGKKVSTSSDDEDGDDKDSEPEEEDSEDEDDWDDDEPPAKAKKPAASKPPVKKGGKTR